MKEIYISTFLDKHRLLSGNLCRNEQEQAGEGTKCIVMHYCEDRLHCTECHQYLW